MIRTLLSLAAICLFPVLGMAATPDLGTDDAALIAHIKEDRSHFHNSIGQMRFRAIRRNAVGGRKQFEYVALCAAKPAPENDCPEYKVRAVGTVDSPSWSTVRDIRLELQCTH